MLHIDYSPYLPKTTYKRNNLDCYLCFSRRQLVISNPEEKVRQAVIGYLIHVLGVPATNIAAEVPMSYFVKGGQGRADIIVGDGNGETLILIECKEERHYLTDTIVDQVLRYDDIVKAKILVVTNGLQTQVFTRRGNKLQELLAIPPYQELISNAALAVATEDPDNYERIDLKKPLASELIAESIDMGYLGADTSPTLYAPILNLMDWMFDVKERIAPFALQHNQLLEDGGIRFAQFGNAGGGSWGGDYRYFIIQDASLNHQIISLSILSSLKTENDPRWGTRKGATYLAVAVDDLNSSHLSLELRLDKYLELTPSSLVIWHDGTLTVGKLGQAKRGAVVEYVAERAPHLVDGQGKIVLGVLDPTQEIRSSQAQTITFVDNVILYALLRDEYRRKHKAELKG
jgi:hypothetical protein